MARRNIQFLPGHYYHIYNRGNNQQRIFFEEQNYLFFLKRLHFCFDSSGIELIAFCLMPNHYHLLVFLNGTSGFSRAMQSFSVSYTKSMNKWGRRVGHLFQGRFQARVIREDRYLSALIRYIHLNPVVAKLTTRPEDWRFSDYGEWISPSTDSTLSSKRVRNQLFGGSSQYLKFVKARMEEKSLEQEMKKFMFSEK